MTRAIDIYQQSDGEVTRSYYAELERRGPVGIIALNLFRAQKCSSRAKVYRGRGSSKWKHDAYRRKNWSLENLCAALNQHADSLFIRYGWKRDPETPAFKWVLYADLPQLGQVSFHSPVRMAGPDYAGEWDGQHQSDNRILTFCDWVMKGTDYVHSEEEREPAGNPVGEARGLGTDQGVVPEHLVP